MKELISFLVKNIAGTDELEIEEKEEAGVNSYVIKVKQEYMGLIIGKGGKTIKTVRTLLKVRATLEKKLVDVNIEEAT